MIKIGLTGGIGSGKTTVANMFKELKVPVFVADVEAKKILDDSQVALEVANSFNLELTSEGLIRKPELAKIVFNDKEALEKLNSIIHPRVHKCFKDWLEDQRDVSYIVYEAAIIFEKNRASDFDYTILVTAPEEIRIQRVMKRDDSSHEDVKSRMNMQWSQSKKKKMADFIIANTNLNETRQRVSELHKEFLNISEK